MPACRCQFCSAPLEPVQEFRFLVETATLEQPSWLAEIRALPSAGGRPLRVCKGCQSAMARTPSRFLAALARSEYRRQVRAGVFAAGLLSLGWVMATMFGDA